PKAVDGSVFVAAWLAIILGAVLSYGQARFFRPFLQRVASKAALRRCESLFDAYGRYARIALFVHPNACSMYFTALGLLGRSLTRELAYLCVGAAAASSTCNWPSSVGPMDDTSLVTMTNRMPTAAALVAMGTLIGFYTAWRPKAA
ncbi:hypothetical protein H1B27_39700, partial [Bradyrhizobium sp. CNPSo 4019]|nr:hypothetical protein [Bradyrhizobium diversitatis]